MQIVSTQFYRFYSKTNPIGLFKERLTKIGLISCVTIIILLLADACRYDDFNSRIPKAEPIPGVIQLNFTSETLTVPESPDAKNSSLQKIQAMPSISKSSFKINIYEDGTSDWSIGKLKPSIDLVQQHQTPASDQPETVETYIDRAGMGSYYSVNHQLIHSAKLPMPSYLELIEKVKTNPAAALSAIGMPSTDKIELLLANAKQKGAVINDLGNGMVSVKVSVGGGVPNDIARQDNSADGNVAINIYNKDLGVLIGSTLYNQAGDILAQSSYRYKLNDDKSLTPEAIHSEIIRVDAFTNQKIKVTLCKSLFHIISNL